MLIYLKSVLAGGDAAEPWRGENAHAPHLRRTRGSARFRQTTAHLRSGATRPPRTTAGAPRWLARADAVSRRARPVRPAGARCRRDRGRRPTRGRWRAARFGGGGSRRYSGCAPRGTATVRWARARPGGRGGYRAGQRFPAPRRRRPRSGRACASRSCRAVPGGGAPELRRRLARDGARRRCAAPPGTVAYGGRGRRRRERSPQGYVRRRLPPPYARVHHADAPQKVTRLTGFWPAAAGPSPWRFTPVAGTSWRFTPVRGTRPVKVRSREGALVPSRDAAAGLLRGGSLPWRVLP